MTSKFIALDTTLGQVAIPISAIKAIVERERDDGKIGAYVYHVDPVENKVLALEIDQEPCDLVWEINGIIG